MTNKKKAIEISKSNEGWLGRWSDGECYESALEAMKWKDEQFKELLETELKRWNGDSCEAKYRTEMLNELIEKINEN